MKLFSYVEVSDRDIDDMAEIMRDVVMSTSDEKKLRHFFSSFIEKIVFYGDRVWIHYNQDSMVSRAYTRVVHSNELWRSGRDSNPRPPA